MTPQFLWFPTWKSQEEPGQNTWDQAIGTSMRAETVFGVLPSPSRVHCTVPGTELMSKQFLNKFDAEDSKITVNRKMRQMCPEGKWTLNL